LFNFNLAAQVVLKCISERGSEDALRDRKNDWAVGIVSDLPLKRIRNRTLS